MADFSKHLPFDLLQNNDIKSFRDALKQIVSASDNPIDEDEKQFFDDITPAPSRLTSGLPKPDDDNMPHNFDSNRHYWSFWGLTGVGKTFLFTRLHIQLLSLRWKLNQPSTPDNDFYREHILRRVRVGHYPNSTTESRIYELRVTPDQQDYASLAGEELPIMLPDIPGDLGRLKAPETEKTEFESLFDPPLDYYDYLARCSVLLLLVDPSHKFEEDFTSWTTYFDEILKQTYDAYQNLDNDEHILSESEDNTLLPHIVLVCITKVDMREIQDILGTTTFDGTEDAEALATQVVKQDGMNVLKNYIADDRLKFFCVSAQGFDNNSRRNLFGGSSSTSARSDQNVFGKNADLIGDMFGDRSTTTTSNQETQPTKPSSQTKSDAPETFDPNIEPYNILEMIEWTLGRLDEIESGR